MSSERVPLAEAPSYSRISRLALPIILANAAQPLLGLADTAFMGHFGEAADLGGIALGTLIFSFVYWGFGFLRMGTTGFVAQAFGAKDNEGVRAAVGRSLLMAVLIGVALVLLQSVIGWAAGYLLDGSEAVRAKADGYFYIRIWGAPATLANFVIFGALIGLGMTRHLLALQLLLNGLNLALNVFFVVVMSFGVRGLALGTVIAELACVGVGLWVLLRVIRPREPQGRFWPTERIMQADAWRHTLRTNSDIMWRTLFILLGFGWFAKQGAGLGDELLAANHILIQVTTFAAFFLDGFAFVVEALVGQTLGAGRGDLFRVALRRSTVLSALTAFALAAGLLLAGPQFIGLMTTLETVATPALHYLPYAAAYIALSFAAFQLDGVFVGATRSREMRNTAAISVVALIALSLVLMPLWGNDGLWVAFVAFVVVRALSLGAYLPRLLREAKGQPVLL